MDIDDILSGGIFTAAGRIRGSPDPSSQVFVPTIYYYSEYYSDTKGENKNEDKII